VEVIRREQGTEMMPEASSRNEEEEEEEVKKFNETQLFFSIVRFKEQQPALQI
jgi:hypothetical protein